MRGLRQGNRHADRMGAEQRERARAGHDRFRSRPRDASLSDRDIEIYATDPAPLLADDSWWDQLGEVLVVERLVTPGWHPSRLVYYVGGKLDLTVIRADALPAIRYERPFAVLVDKDGLNGSLRVAAAGTSLPDEAAFEERLNWGYAAALMCAKAIVRDEPWSSKIRDRDLKASLLTLIEWDHQLRHGPDHDVRFLGSRLRKWMDEDVQQALEQCWGHFDAVDSAKALRASIALFARLGSRIADGLGFGSFHHESVHREVEAILAKHPGTG
jgi:aminoglycoside 6-adenylyltransferase